ncbi:sensor histidine kinase [Cytobacillus purgationiresistens]|uniref:Heme sensor protein HssS n=1 Tax=Cytobacillus purgationiresistens TaxID=863449 RepID=A0ABU0AGS3_9BACI|nr:HAMP domain-containing sensor histidine kinase [Cytobacillus purgationiresistens]MDQ0270449.1 signal transduction histidine kinase [Cytobacillus purgationiresistens]
MKTLYSKIAITTIVIMLISSLLSFFISNLYYQKTLKPLNDEKVTNIGLELVAFLNHHQQLNIDEYLHHIGDIGYQLYVTDGQNDHRFYGAEYRETNLPNTAVGQVLRGDIYHGISNFPITTFVTGFFANELKNSVGVQFEHGGHTYALFIRPDIKLLFSEMHIMFGWLLFGILVLSILFVLISTKYIVKPISKLNEATAIIADGRFGIQLNTSQKDEIGELSASFMKMARKLDKANEMRKEFISNISHDIQSPLSNIKGYLNLFKKKTLSAEERDYIHVVEGEVDRLSNLTNQLLLLSSIDTKKDLVNRSSFDISDQIKLVIKQNQWYLEEKGIMVSYALPPFQYTGDPSLLYSIWENLMTNAIKYSDENGEIDIRLEEKADSVHIHFQDDGIGLTNAEIERIFERLYRADISRNRAVKGTGLGLAIVQSIIELHDGKIFVESEKTKGTTFTIILPKNADL